MCRREHEVGEQRARVIKGLELLGPQAFKSRQELESASGTLVFDARVGGLTRIDYVVISTKGMGLFAAQGRMADPAQKRTYVDKAQAISQQSGTKQSSTAAG